VIENSGICTFAGKVLEIPLEEVRGDYETNTQGPRRLFQARFLFLSSLKSKIRDRRNGEVLFIFSGGKYRYSATSGV
jgi:hypothetical protein